jgi:hypothetical protein
MVDHLIFHPIAAENLFAFSSDQQECGCIWQSNEMNISGPMHEMVAGWRTTFRYLAPIAARNLDRRPGNFGNLIQQIKYFSV